MEIRLPLRRLALLIATLGACDAPSAPAPPLIIQRGDSTVLVGDSLQLSVTGAAAPVTWSSSDSTVARVTVAGGVVGVAPGNATISATESGRIAVASVRVIGRALLEATDTLISFETGPLEAPPRPRTARIQNVGGAPFLGVESLVSYEGVGSGWLSLSAEADSASILLTLSPDASALPVGRYRAAALVSVPKAENSPLSIPVHLTVSEPAAIALDPAALQLGALVGAVSPTETVSIRNAGQRPLGVLSVDVQYLSGAADAWLAASLISEPALSRLTVSGSAQALGEGTYEAVVWIRSDLPHVLPVPLAVEFEVGSRPAIQVSPTSIAFYALQDSIDPLPQTIQIGNAGGGTLGGLVLTGPHYGPGASGWLDASLSASVAPAQVLLQASIAGLPGGTYYADLEIGAAAVQDSPRTVRVVLTVEGPWIYLAFNGAPFTLARGTVSGPSWFPVYNGGGGVLSGLSLTLNQTGPPGLVTVGFNGPPTAPVSVGITRNATGVPVGAYSAEVIISSSLLNVRPDTMVFEITVEPEPRIVLTPSTLNLTADAGAVGARDSLAVSNGGGGLLNSITTAVLYPPGGATGWLNANVPYVEFIRVQPNAQALAPGTYTATLRVSSPQPHVLPVDVPVTLVVQ